MSNIVKKIKESIKIEETKFNHDNTYLQFKEYLTEMQENGLLQPLYYALPPLDTIGKRLYQAK